MNFTLDALPYPKNALEPHISQVTVEIHYEKHHKGYLKKLHDDLESSAELDASLRLIELIRRASGDRYNNAAQVWNHSFYWKSMKPAGGGEPSGQLRDRIEACFGSTRACRDALADAATGEFGSGWAWLVQGTDGALRAINSSDAENPIRRGHRPLLAIDVWEHAYYLDRQNDRGAYVEAFLDHLVDWDFAARNFERKGNLENPLDEQAGEAAAAAGTPAKRGAARDAPAAVRPS